MEKIDQVGRTAMIIADVRAGEAARPQRLFHDPYALLFSHPEITGASRRYEEVAPFLTHSVRLRTRWFDEVLTAAIAGGTSQILILGAGLDCRALRFARRGVTFYEVDRGEVLEYKAAKLAEAGHAHDAVKVGADYTAPGLLEALADRGFDRDRETLVLWEGNTYYLPPHLTRDVLGALRRGVRRLRVAFDYFATVVIEGRSASPSMARAIPILRSIGAPWQGGIDDLHALARDVDLKVETHLDTRSLHAAYAASAIDLGPDVHAEYGACVLAS